MIIFGTRGYLRVLAMVNFICNNCHNPAAQRVVARITRFTLFFIPLFPIAKSYTTTCTFCGFSQRINKDLADQYAANGQQASGPVGPAREQIPAGQPGAQQFGQPAQYPQPQQYGQQPGPSQQSGSPQAYGQPQQGQPQDGQSAAPFAQPQQFGQPQQHGQPQQFGQPQQHGQAQSDGNQHFGDPSAPQFPR
jgi:hypothetical protein